MQVQWYPGHMAKAKRMLAEQLKLIDLVIEVLDARIPRSSANPDLNNLIGAKPRLSVLNKADLADPKASREWISYFANLGIKALAVNSNRREGMADVVKAAELLAEDKLMQGRRKYLLKRPVRAIVVGIPNVGKSSLINGLVKKSSARTGDKPGITKGKQWIRVLTNLELLDTPGLLWPKFEEPEVGFHLAITGAISDQVYDLVEAAVKLLAVLKREYAAALIDRYKLTELKEDNHKLLEELGVRRGLLGPGGIVEVEKTALMLLQDFRQGKLGRITLEKVSEGKN
ncbi:ribosome biogenesis GTPase YlqF [Zhaonella formicivorans]|uniref:ribosome biogenesis GTPase YlqF n=1 Tax=Zhaonella formicivorans TaxID=2528593 RepID=UPI0010EB7DB7|nr:ribosome biogenesis GTPase YlqF [Zhaonella formicivorans]